MLALKYLALLLVTLAFRFVPHPANFELVIPLMLPLSQKDRLAGAVFGPLCVITLDFFTGKLGAWTIYTSLAFVLVSLAPLSGSFVKRGILATLVYDSVTAAIFGVQFGQGFWQTALGQVPFTLNHLLSSTILCSLVSPLALVWLEGEDAAMRHLGVLS